MEAVVGFHPVREALRAQRRRLHRLRIREDLRHPDLPGLVVLAEAAGVAVERVPEADLLRGLRGAGGAGGPRDQGFVLEAGPLPSPSLEALLGAAAGEEGSAVAGAGAARLVVLDGVEDPQNLGAVARVAEAAGAAGLVIGERRAPPLGAAASRASAGALEHLPVARVPNLARALRTLRDAGHWLVGADLAGEDLYAVADRVFEGPLGLVFGAEGRGIRPGVARHLDHRVRIPLAGRVASLNVATAAAVVLFEVGRRLGFPRGAPAARAASARN